MSRITIPSSVTHIGSDSFKNTNNASIYLLNRTSVPNTFDINWNSSVNPVYLNGKLCSHTSSMITVSLNDTHHANPCSDCRTAFSKFPHRKYVFNNYDRCYDCDYSKLHKHEYSLTWVNYRQHESRCFCGYTINLRGHVVSSNWNGIGYATCLECNGPAELGFIEMSNFTKNNQIRPLNYIDEYFGNNSYILLNGVIVLSDVDLEAYYNGMLVLPDTYYFNYHHNSYCDDYYLDYLDFDSYSYDFVNYGDVDVCYDIRKTHYLPTSRKDKNYFDNRAQ